MSRMLLECYRSIEISSQKMLAAAQSRQWEQVAQQETLCARLIAELRDRARQEELDVDGRQEKSRIMRNILRNDALIRQLAEPWIDDLDGTNVAVSRPTLH